MNGRERLQATLNHQQPDRVCVDFGATPVTGIHVAVVHKLHQAVVGDPSHRVKVVEPYQMLGEVDERLRDGPGHRRGRRLGPPLAVRHRRSGLEAVHPVRRHPGAGAAQLQPDRGRVQRRSADLSRGRHVGAAQRPHAQGRPFLRCHHPPGAARRKISWTPPTTWRSSGRWARRIWPTTGRNGPWLDSRSQNGGLVVVPGTAFGDIALVPGTFLKHPKGIRDVEEWYVSTAVRQRLRPPRSSKSSARSACGTSRR